MSLRRYTVLPLLATLGAIGACGMESKTPPLPSSSDLRATFNRPQETKAAAEPAPREEEEGKDMPSSAPAGLEERIVVSNAKDSNGFTWRNFRYPLAAGDISAVETYSANVRNENGAYVARSGITLRASAGKYVRYHKDMFRYGDWIKETHVTASDDDAPAGFPRCGRHVRLRHTFSDRISGIGNHLDTLYCNLDIRAVRKGEKMADNAPDGGAIVGTVGKSGEGVTRSQLTYLILSGAESNYNTYIHPWAVLKPRR